MLSVLGAMEERAQALKVKLQSLKVRGLEELNAALQLARMETEGLTVVDEGPFVANAGRLAELAIKNRLPSIGFREFCEAGGLLAYGVDFPYIWRQAEALVDKIFKGASRPTCPSSRRRGSSCFSI